MDKGGHSECLGKEMVGLYAKLAVYNNKHYLPTAGTDLKNEVGMMERVDKNSILQM